MTERLRKHPALFTGLLLALLAYLPALTASPGRMVSDSKLYLYLDPGRFLGDNLYSFDARQFAGWVPHQHISYLWPSGPWYWLFETLGAPDWIAHRLWIGTLMVVAGLGARWAARQLGLTAGAAVVVAVFYQLSPYVLPYVSRTSVMLLPFAGLGWILGLTVVATGRRGWAAPAGIALIVLTVGAVNATALTMIIPAPLLWLVHAALRRAVTVRRVLIIAGQTALLCAGVSVWWVAMLSLQARHGVDVIAFSEALADVALTSTAPEVLRSLGYWLFYVRDAFGPTTTASLGYLTSSRYLLISYLVPLVGAFGIVAAKWVHRRFAAWLVGAGFLLAVGVHPTDDPAPLIDLVTGGGESGLAEALRSSTRALPLVALGLGLGAGALVQAIPSAGRLVRWSWSAVRPLAVAGLCLLAIVNLPALWNGGFTDPELDRDQDPPSSWQEAADDLDARPAGSRVLQLPGAEFGTFRWGHTVDQPLPGLTERPLVTRDLLPLGSPAAMDLVFALDDRLQSGVLEPDSVAPVARLLGADVVWGANDSAFERYRTARPELVQDLLRTAEGLSRDGDFGEPEPNVPSRSMLDETELVVESVGREISDVTLWSVEDPLPVIRAGAEAVLVSGSGDGLIDMAAAGVLDPDGVVRYTATMSAEELQAAAASGERLVVTDSNRDRAHHWRSSQDVVGVTESGGAGAEVLEPVVGDERLDVFGLAEEVPSSAQTVAIQDGPVTAAASDYGEPFAYRPESRAAMAIDGDLTTSWRVADRAEAVGEYLELRADSDVDRIRVRQPDPIPHARTITALDVTVGIAAPVRIPLTQASLEGQGEWLAVPPVRAGTPVRLTIAETSVPEVLTPEILAAVGFAEVDLGLGETTEWIRPPVDALESGWPGEVTSVLTRHRVDPRNRWRSDPEPALQRLLPASAAGTELEPADVDVTLRLHQRADDRVLHELLPVDDQEGRTAVASSRLTGSWSAWGHAAVDGDPGTAWRSPFGQPVGHRLIVDHGGPEVRRFRLLQPAGGSRITEIRLFSGKESDTVAVPEPDSAGWSRIRVTDALAGPRLTLVITEVEDATTIDPRYGEITVLPSGIAEIQIPGALAPATLPDEVDAECRDDLLTVDGVPVAVSFRATTDDLLAGSAVPATLCDKVAVTGSDLRVRSTPGAVTGLDVDRVVLRSSATPADGAARPGVELLEQGQLDRTVRLSGCAEGCWVVLGEGYNEAWSASLDGESLGEPVLVDGGFNGWRVPPGPDDRIVEFSWTAQRTLTLALLLTLATALLAIGLVVVSVIRARRGQRDESPPEEVLVAFAPAPDTTDARNVTIATITWILGAALFVDWTWGLIAALGSLVVWHFRRPGALALAGWAGLVGVGVAVLLLQRSEDPFPNGGWPLEFSELHEITLFAVVTMVVGASLPVVRGRPPSPTIGRS